MSLDELSGAIESRGTGLLVGNSYGLMLIEL